MTNEDTSCPPVVSKVHSFGKECLFELHVLCILIFYFLINNIFVKGRCNKVGRKQIFF